MPTFISTLQERAAAFTAVKAVLMPEVPGMFKGMVKDDLIRGLSDAAVEAAAVEAAAVEAAAVERNKK